MNVNEFQVGEYVQIREDLKDFDEYEWPTINDNMFKLAGTIQCITGKSQNADCFAIEGYWWIPKWIRKIGDEEESPIKINVDTLL